MASSDPTTDLIQSVVACMYGADNDDWVAMAAVLDPKDGRMFALSRTSGYVYAADGTAKAVGIDAVGLSPAMRAYMESQYAPGEPWPARLLLQFDRISGDYEITVEESATSRWQLHGENSVGELEDEIRPSF